MNRHETVTEGGEMQCWMVSRSPARPGKAAAPSSSLTSLLRSAACRTDVPELKANIRTWPHLQAGDRSPPDFHYQSSPLPRALGSTNCSFWHRLESQGEVAAGLLL